MTTATHTRICSICEAGCGLSISADGREVTAIAGNDEDHFSQGHVCAKGIALKELDADPDRLRTPLIRVNGHLQPASWDAALTMINERLQSIVAEHGSKSVAAYIGNPTAHNAGSSMGLGPLLSTLESRAVFSAGSVDQLPKHLACELMFGDDFAIPVPDILNCDYLVILGANPVVSNASLWMVPKIREHLRALKQRGGKLVTVDPRRTETARLADEHLAIEPGADAWLLIGLINHLYAAGARPSASLPCRPIEPLVNSIAHINPNTIAERTGLPAATIDSLATALLNADAPVLYGRIGTTVQRFGTLTSFLIEIVNTLIGALDQRGGAMFPEQPFFKPRPPSGLRYNRYQSRVSGCPEVLGQLPVAVLAEEIETPGEGQIRALFCFSGNPVVSNPDSQRLAKALDTLDLLVCCDIYQTETTRSADVVLPGTSPFEECHYDSFLGSMGYKNTARFSPALFPAEQPDEWDIALTLGYIATKKQVPSASELRTFEDQFVASAASAMASDADSTINGMDVQQIMANIAPSRGVERLLDLGIRAGRFGDGFGRQEGLTLQSMAESPNGIELGAIRANRLPEIITHTDGLVDLAPPLILEDIQRLLATETESGFKLIGRRNTRTNNSWLRNLPMLAKGSNLCTLQLHPQDAQALELTEGDWVRVRSSAAAITVQATLTADMRPGVVSLPHGFSAVDDLPQSQLKPAANYNDLVPADHIDQLGATSALNGIAVQLEKVTAPESDSLNRTGALGTSP